MGFHAISLLKDEIIVVWDKNITTVYQTKISKIRRSKQEIGNKLTKVNANRAKYLGKKYIFYTKPAYHFSFVNYLE